MSFRTAFAIAIPFFVGSCNRPVFPDASPVPVAAADLASVYRTDPGTAALAYTGKVVRVRVVAFNTAGPDIHWRPAYTDPLPPPALVFRFAEPPTLKPPCWIEGVCIGGTPVVVTGCRVAPPIRPTGP